MATIIDSLVVKFGIQVDKRGAKEAASDLRNLKKEAGEAKKEENAAAKARAEAFDKARGAALRFFAVLTVGAGATGFTRYVINTGAQLDRMSKNLGTSADRLSRWQGAVRMSGGTAEGALGSFQSLNASLTELKLTGNTGILPYLQALGVSLSDASGKARPLEDILLDVGDSLKKVPNREDAYNIGRNLGLDDGTVNLLMRSRTEIEGMLKAQKGFSDADAKAAREAQENWEKTKIKIEQTTQKIVIALIPALEQVAESMVQIAEVATPLLKGTIDGFNSVNEATNGWLLTIGLVLVALKAATSLLGSFKAAGAAGGLGGLARLGAVGAAGAGGYAVGGLISKEIEGTEMSNSIGRATAQVLAFFGNKEAQEALDLESGKSRSTSPSSVPYNMANEMAAAEKKNGLPSGLLSSILKQEIGGRKEFLDDPSKYHYEKDANGKRKSSAFGPFGLLDSTAKDPGYGVKPLVDKSLSEQIRFAAQYSAARIKASGGDIAKGLAGYGEGDKYASQVMSRLPGGVMSGVQNVGMGGGGGGSTVSIGEVKVYTQATDANGIARDMTDAIIRQADAGMR